MTERADDLASWYGQHIGVPAPQLALAAGDASFRKYYRPHSAGVGPVILCDAPPETEKNAEFVAIAQALERAGVRVPRVLHADLEHGFLALEDLGDQILLPLLSPQNVDKHYGEALSMLESLAALDPAPLSLPVYDRAELTREMNLFPDWFCAALLDLPLDTRARSGFDALGEALCKRAQAQPQVVVHRDFHARNLMVPETGAMATIDFQDAVIGAITYDPVSLLRDCYLRWPRENVERWALQHRNNLAAHGLAVPEPGEFLIDFDWMGLQRHIKVLGIFARLHRRDGKSGYLPDLPRVIAYVREVLARYRAHDAFAVFSAWFESEIVPRTERQPWYRDLGSLPA